MALLHRATEAAFLITGCSLPRTGTGLRKHVPLLIEDIGLPAQNSVDVTPHVTQDDLNRSRHTSSLCLPHSLWTVLVPGQWCAAPEEGTGQRVGCSG